MAVHFDRLKGERGAVVHLYGSPGLAGAEAQAAEKKLASKLSWRWPRHYSKMVAQVRVRLQIAVVRLNTVMLRGPRTRFVRLGRPAWEDGYGFDLLDHWRD